MQERERHDGGVWQDCILSPVLTSKVMEGFHWEVLLWLDLPSEEGLDRKGSTCPVWRTFLEIIRMCILFFAPVFFPQDVKKGCTFLHWNTANVPWNCNSVQKRAGADSAWMLPAGQRTFSSNVNRFFLFFLNFWFTLKPCTSWPPRAWPTNHYTWSHSNSWQWR